MDNNRKPKPTLTELAEAVLKLPWDALQAELAFRRMDRDAWHDMALGLVKKSGDFVQIGTYHPSPDPELPVKTYEAAMVKKWVSSTTPLHPRMGAKLVRTGDVDAGSDVYHQCEPDSDQWTHTLKGFFPQDTSKLMLTMRHVNADIIVRADQVTFKQPQAHMAAPGQKLLKAGTLMYREPSTGRLHVYRPDTPAGVERFLLAHDVDIDSLTLQPISLHPAGSGVHAYQPVGWSPQGDNDGKEEEGSGPLHGVASGRICSTPQAGSIQGEGSQDRQRSRSGNTGKLGQQEAQGQEGQEIEKPLPGGFDDIEI
jgi:hypothetical protein